MNIDREIAEKVMGWGKWTCDTILNGGVAWNPSTDIKQAFEVVEKMRKRGLRFQLWDNIDSWAAQFINIIQKPKGSYSYDTQYFQEDSDTPAMAICLAALKAVKE